MTLAKAIEICKTLGATVNFQAETWVRFNVETMAIRTKVIETMRDAGIFAAPHANSKMLVIDFGSILNRAHR